jgi:predicted transcriptional regulator
MLDRRLQILLSPDQHRRLEVEAKRRRTSVGSLIREAIDARFGAVAQEDRLQAVREIAAMRGAFLEPEELARVIDDERLSAVPPPQP